ncbi:hypothetical protein BRADI_4g28162v3 [Brachypodium distachyon]|uniref:Reverse transcriptase zinc-binding domain-containing protein n=1 Tax=Brachypodium distachyon TaxID=15368 RepID=A0A2K2CQV6_BRADI|nr:hypothetical protein BRADI_4g28162v3 [Brachypodium distachyon]
MLRMRKYNAGDTWLCALCHPAPPPPPETLEHLFFGCRFAQDCWAEIGITWDQNSSIIHNIDSAKRRWNHGLFWEIFMLGSWGVWKERNAKIFENIAPSKRYWKRRLKADLELLNFRFAKDSQNTQLACFVFTL